MFTGSGQVQARRHARDVIFLARDYEKILSLSAKICSCHQRNNGQRTTFHPITKKIDMLICVNYDAARRYLALVAYYSKF